MYEVEAQTSLASLGFESRLLGWTKHGSGTMVLGTVNKFLFFSFALPKCAILLPTLRACHGFKAPIGGVVFDGVALIACRHQGVDLCSQLVGGDGQAEHQESIFKDFLGGGAGATGNFNCRRLGELIDLLDFQPRMMMLQFPHYLLWAIVIGQLV